MIKQLIQFNYINFCLLVFTLCVFSWNQSISYAQSEDHKAKELEFETYSLFKKNFKELIEKNESMEIEKIFQRILVNHAIFLIEKEVPWKIVKKAINSVDKEYKIDKYFGSVINREWIKKVKNYTENHYTPYTKNNHDIYYFYKKIMAPDQPALENLLNTCFEQFQCFHLTENFEMLNPLEKTLKQIEEFLSQNFDQDLIDYDQYVAYEKELDESLKMFNKLVSKNLSKIKAGPKDNPYREEIFIKKIIRDSYVVTAYYRKFFEQYPQFTDFQLKFYPWHKFRDHQFLLSNTINQMENFKKLRDQNAFYEIMEHLQYLERRIINHYETAAKNVLK